MCRRARPPSRERGGRVVARQLALLEVLVAPLGLAGDADEDASVDESVGDGACGGGVVEELAPVLEGEVGGDDGRRSLVAPIDDLVEQVCAARVEGEVAELVDQQQVWCRPGVEPPVEGVAALAGDTRSVLAPEVDEGREPVFAQAG